MSPYLIADSFVSFAAVIGLLILRSILKQDDNPTPLVRRFLFGITALLLMLVSRVLWWITDLDLFDTLTIIGAGLVPLSILLLYEGLLRQHAPSWLKIFTGIGTLLFVLTAFLDPQVADPPRIAALMVFQVAVLLSIGWLTLFRDKSSLSKTENQIIERLGLSLILILPFVVTDYRSEWINVPVRMSGIAILFTCWLAISLGRQNLRHREIIISFLILIGSSIAAGLSIGLFAAFDLTTTIQTIAIIISAGMLAAVYNESKTVIREEQRESLLRYIAESGAKDTSSFLLGIQNHSLVESALILRKEDLADFNEAFFDTLSKQGIWRYSDLETIEDKELQEQFSWYFEKFNATHALFASQNPLILVALNLPALSTTPGAEIELKVVQRISALLSERQSP